MLLVQVPLRRRCPTSHLAEENSGKSGFGVGVSSNITRSSVRAIFSAMNRLLFPEEAEAEGKKRVAEEKAQ